jgi:hypothetical protein
MVRLVYSTVGCAHTSNLLSGVTQTALLRRVIQEMPEYKSNKEKTIGGLWPSD